MADSQFRLVGRGLGVLVAASLLAGVSVDAAAAGSKGQVRLQLGPQGNPAQFIYIKPDGTSSTQIDRFGASKGKEKCFFTWEKPLDAKLIDIAAFASGASATLGVGPDSIGVYNGASGVSCYRVENRFAEVLSLSLGSGLESRVAAATGETSGSLYFDRLELDLELKGNAEVVLTVHLGTKETFYTLRSGTSVVSGQGTSGESGPGSSDEMIFNCSAGSDSGPDSGPSDNCRWVINDLGDSFTLSTLRGEFSLEGGGDFAPNDFANNTVIFLTSLIESGNLYCNPNNSDPKHGNQTGIVGGGPVASCQTTRINPNNLGQFICPEYPADEISYDLETFVGDGSKCELRKTSESTPTQFAGSIQITFEPETSTDWNVNQTKISFSCPPNNPKCELDARDQWITTKPLVTQRCKGTVVDDANGNLTILEVLSGGASPAVDQVPDNGVVDWACVLDHREVFTGSGKMQVTQTILYWGDISFARD